jgi:hypothetical protein
MTTPTPAETAQYEAEKAAVLAVLNRPAWRHERHTSLDLARAAKLTNIRTLAALKRLRAQGLVESDADQPIAERQPSKLLTLWRLPSDKSGLVERRDPVCPSTQPNGSTEFWAGFMGEMNAPARLELLK